MSDEDLIPEEIRREVEENNPLKEKKDERDSGKET